MRLCKHKGRLTEDDITTLPLKTNGKPHGTAERRFVTTKAYIDTGHRLKHQKLIIEPSWIRLKCSVRGHHVETAYWGHARHAYMQRCLTPGDLWQQQLFPQGLPSIENKLE